MQQQVWVSRYWCYLWLYEEVAQVLIVQAKTDYFSL